MSIVYKLELNSKIDIHEVEKMILEINKVISKDGMSVMDFNLEIYEDDLVLMEQGDEKLIWSKPEDKFYYLSGYMSFSKEGKYDYFFKKFKKEVLKLYPDLITKVMIQEPHGVILDEDFQEIPDPK